MSFLDKAGGFLVNLFGSDKNAKSDKSGIETLGAELNAEPDKKVDVVMPPVKTELVTREKTTDPYNPISVKTENPYTEKVLTDLYNNYNTAGASTADYYPNANSPIHQGNVQIGNMSAPIYAYNPGVTPTAAIDANKRQQYFQDAIQEYKNAEESKINVMAPEIRNAGLRQNLTNQTMDKTHEVLNQMQSKYGKGWEKKMQSDPEYWKHVNDVKSIEHVANEGYLLADEFLKHVATAGDKVYVSPEAMYAAKYLKHGIDELSQGKNVKPEELVHLMGMLNTYSNYDTRVTDELKNDKILSSLEFDPNAIEIKVKSQAQADPNGVNDADYQKALKRGENFANGYHGYLVTKEVKGLARPTAEAIFDNWNKSNPEAWTQLKEKDTDNIKSIRERSVNQLVNRIGQIKENQFFDTRPVKGTTINVSNGNTGKDEGGFYGTTLKNNNTIDNYIINNESELAKNPQEVMRKAYGQAVKGWAPNETYVGVSTPGKFKNANMPTQVINYDEYFYDEPAEQRTKTGVIIPNNGKSKTGNFKPMKLPEGVNAGDAPDKATIEDVSIVYGIRKPDGSYKILTNDQIKSGDYNIGDFEKLIMQKDRLQRRINDGFNKYRTITDVATRFMPYDAEQLRELDEKVSNASKGEHTQGTGKINTKVTVTGSDSEIE